MVYRGHIRNGVVAPDEPLPLPEGTEVNIEPADSGPPMTLAELFKDVIGVVTDLPEDMAENHDHYLHGTPKR